MINKKDYERLLAIRVELIEILVELERMGMKDTDLWNRNIKSLQKNMVTINKFETTFNMEVVLSEEG